MRPIYWCTKCHYSNEQKDINKIKENGKVLEATIKYYVDYKSYFGSFSAVASFDFEARFEVACEQGYNYQTDQEMQTDCIRVKRKGLGIRDAVHTDLGDNADKVIGLFLDLTIKFLSPKFILSGNLYKVKN